MTEIIHDGDVYKRQALDEAKPILFFPGSVRVDRDEFTEQLDQLKKMMPVQLERASALMRESERRLESAQTQANAIVASAQSRAADTIREANEQAQFLAGQENVTELARQKARAIPVSYTHLDVYKRQMLDLPYIEDSKAMTDMNVAMTGSGEFIEIQGTAEHRPFNRAELNALLDLAEKGNKELQAAQQSALAQD